MIQQLRDCPVGSILLTYGDGPKPGGLAGLALKAAYSGIRKHQEYEHPRGGFNDAVHVQIKVGFGGRAGLWVSATYPRVIETDYPVEFNQKARLYQYFADLSPEAEKALSRYARSMVGKKYDTLQLLGIATAAQRFLPRFFRSWLGHRLQLPGQLEVCSTLAHRALLKAWELDNHGQFYRPLGKLDAFDCYPAAFSYHDTFELIAEQNV